MSVLGTDLIFLVKERILPRGNIPKGSKVFWNITLRTLKGGWPSS